MNAASRAILVSGAMAVAALAGCGGNRGGKGATTAAAVVDVRDVIADTQTFNGQMVESTVLATTGVIGDFYSAKPGRQESPLVLALKSSHGQQIKDILRKHGKTQELLIRYRVHIDARTHGVLQSIEPINVKPPSVPAGGAGKSTDAGPAPIGGVDDSNSDATK